MIVLDPLPTPIRDSVGFPECIMVLLLNAITEMFSHSSHAMLAKKANSLQNGKLGSNNLFEHFYEFQLTMTKDCTAFITYLLAFEPMKESCSKTDHWSIGVDVYYLL